MERNAKGKLWVMGASFALFLGGIAALQLESGAARTALLAVVFAGLLSIAGVQTYRRLKKK